MDTDVSFGRWLEKRRKALDLTREEFAHKVGCSASALRKIETDTRRPSKQLAEQLASILGVPTEERATFIRIARGELSIGKLKSPTSLSGLPQLQPPQALSSSIPIPPTPLIGRESELSALGQMLADPQCRLITLVGLGGMGKTRLAVEVACNQYNQYEDGVALVSLANLDAPALIAPTIANALGISFPSTTDPMRHLLNNLRGRQLLLVVDNAEHLLDGVNVFAEIMESAPRVKILCTSREPLKLRGEWLFEVRGLLIPRGIESAEFDKNSAVALFLQRANQANAKLRLKDVDRAAVVRICRLVEGAPLAIELSAVWTQTLSCPEIALEIEKSLDFLSTTMHDVPERHRSLRAVFDHSWQLLTAEERHVLVKLSVFRGGFTRELAAEVAGANLVSLSALVTKSLVQRIGEKRYDVHAMVQQYASAQLQLAEDVGQAHAAHLQAFIHLAETVEPKLTQSGQSYWLMYMEIQHDNFRTALRWAFESGDSESALRLAAALWRFWYMRSHLVEGTQWLEKALQVAGVSAPVSLRAKVLNGAGLLAYYQGHLDRAQRWLEECLALQTGLSERDIAYAQLTLALVVHDQLDFSGASVLYQDALQRFYRLNDSFGIIRTLNSQGALASDAGNLDAADKLYKESLVLARKRRDKENVAMAVTNLGWNAALRGDIMSVELCQEAITLFCDLGNKLGIAFSMEGIAAGLVLAGQWERAIRLLGSAGVLRKTIDAPPGGVHARNLETIIQRTRNAISDSAFAIAWAQGEAMPMERAIAEAIGLADVLNDHTTPNNDIEAHEMPPRN